MYRVLKSEPWTVWSHGSCVGISYWLHGRGILLQSPVWARDLISSLKDADRLRVLANRLFSGIRGSFSGSKAAGTWSWPFNAYLVPRLRMDSALCALHCMHRDSFTVAPWKIETHGWCETFWLYFWLLCAFGGLFEQNTTSLLIAAAHLVLFVAWHSLTPDGWQIESVWRSITYNFGRTGRLAPVSPSWNSANTALLIA